MFTPFESLNPITMSKLFFAFVALFLLASCDNYPETVPGEPNTPFGIAYYPLAVGNYWVYENVRVNAEGDETIEEFIDSLVITCDTLIGGKQFFVLTGRVFPHTGEMRILEILRDSMGYVTNSSGEIRMSDSDFEEVLFTRTEMHNGDTLVTTTYRMEAGTDILKVPAGSFEVIKCRGVVDARHLPEGLENPRYQDNYYARGTGRVQYNIFYLFGAGYWEKKLVRYGIFGPA
jgi:hypothetical protein